ncbi:cytochrome P450 [Gordonia rubripertincta]|uniref:Cytochrome P450 n=2 Tax=Gordonia rubripertincta TaxID=36822 RepID=A0AAW6RGX3_GORRU|nr:cytochrome P450 [Gordonia rubripertincta]MDG6783685.1 cytochrome P450 [Gordonia rubripertincta]NKY65759.1 cytochrome P450 [Gordonia rubripertincta]GAB84100.1 putative cytochrome P450 [Gordonia rubripertincta NBRC 101908]
MTQESITAEKSAPEGVPVSDVNLHVDEILTNPYPTYAALRETGPVVWMSHYGYYALPRYEEVSSTLADWETFTSGEGVGFNDMFNSIRETSLMNEGDLHDQIRQVEGCPIKKGPLEELKPRLASFSDDLIAELRDRPQLDGVADIAMRMPIDVVTDLVGIAEAGRAQFFEWGKAGFDSIGPLDAPRTGDALQTMGGYFQYAAENFPNNIREGGWADQLFKNGAEAGWTEDFCRGVMNDYVYPSIDSTISAIGIGLLLFAENPDQWDLLRKDRSLLSRAIPEIVRLASPLQFFTRVATADATVAGTVIPKGSRIIVMYGSANRDDRQFPDPDRFDITRDPTQHLGWGRGKHSCLGKPLARLEMTTLFNALADHVERFHAGNHRYEPNNIIRSLGELELTITWAD